MLHNYIFMAIETLSREKYKNRLSAAVSKVKRSLTFGGVTFPARHGRPRFIPSFVLDDYKKDELTNFVRIRMFACTAILKRKLRHYSAIYPN